MVREVLVKVQYKDQIWYKVDKVELETAYGSKIREGVRSPRTVDRRQETKGNSVQS